LLAASELCALEKGAVGDAANLPLVREMPGKAEGGAKDRYFAVVIPGRSKERSDARRR